MQEKRDVVLNKEEEEIWRMEVNVCAYFACVVDTLSKAAENTVWVRT